MEGDGEEDEEDEEDEEPVLFAVAWRCEPAMANDAAAAAAAPKPSPKAMERVSIEVMFSKTSESGRRGLFASIVCSFTKLRYGRSPRR